MILMTFENKMDAHKTAFNAANKEAKINLTYELTNDDTSMTIGVFVNKVFMFGHRYKFPKGKISMKDALDALYDSFVNSMVHMAMNAMYPYVLQQIKLHEEAETKELLKKTDELDAKSVKEGKEKDVMVSTSPKSTILDMKKVVEEKEKKA